MRRRAGKAKYLAELLFPPRCALCGGVRPMAARCCASCKSDFARLRLAPEDADLSGAPGREGESLGGVCASFLYAPPVSDAVAEYKFRGAAWLAREFAEFIADDFSAVFPAVTPDIALGAPSFERRNDHAERLASQVARLLAVRYEPRALRISYPCPTPQLAPGLQRFQEFFAELK